MFTARSLFTRFVLLEHGGRGGLGLFLLRFGFLLSSLHTRRAPGSQETRAQVSGVKEDM